MATPARPAQSFDALLPREMALKAESLGVKKAAMDAVSTFVLAVMAGAFIGLGAVFSTTVVAGATGQLPFGVIRLAAGVTFSLGLILVIVGGAELFTGNNLLVMAWASGKVTTGRLLRNWAIVYVGNFVGAAGTAALVFLGEHHAVGQGTVGAAALNIANAKVGLGFMQAVALGVLCNGLVCLAVWLTYSGRSATDKILCIIPPITAFVAAGFEHSIANMYFIPAGLLIKDGAADSFWSTIGASPDSYPNLTWGRCFLGNLLPVTIGNIVGGVLLVGAAYWLVYLRKQAQPPEPASILDSTPQEATTVF